MKGLSKGRSRFRDLPINRKLVSVVAIGSAISAIVIGGALFSFQMLNLRDQFSDNVVSVAEVVADYVTAPIAFGDRAGALEVLAALQTNRDITSAAIWMNSGEVFTRFGRTEDEAFEAPDGEVAHFHGWTLHVARMVDVPGQSDTWLVVTADFKRVFYSGIQNMGLAILAVLFVGVLIAVVTTTAFRGVIVGPIIELADVARQVAEERDYTLRATVDGKDEVGFLTSTFNNMLSRVEASDREVRNAYSKLESETAERLRLKDDLVKTSRMAGMAEVVTGVLHNVGNVLNTVNLSVQHVQEKLETTRLDHLRKAVGVIQEQNGNLGDFLANDTRGQALPDFLGKVTEHLETENTALRKEMKGLIGHVEHIKEIVSTQQSYARVLGVTERLKPEDLVEDAIRLSLDSLNRHKISVVREFEQIPTVLADRHKVIQILINLIANAKDAMLKVEPANRIVTIRLSEGADDTVKLSVSDSGEGIAPDALPNIFRHGFTTKASGHGFGLHLSALSAQEMGGTLKVHSDGPGQGAKFTLCIPVAQQPVPA